MNRAEAFKLVVSRLGHGPTLHHCLACEACMEALARRFDQDPMPWGLAGLVHDMDLNVTENDKARHALVAAEILIGHGVENDVVQAVLGHNDKADRTTLMSRALWVVDPTTGFITAAALVRPSRSTADLGVSSIKKRMKDKRFAAAVSRERMKACQSELGMELDEFLGLCLSAMNDIRTEIGL